MKKELTIRCRYGREEGRSLVLRSFALFLRRELGFLPCPGQKP